MKFMYVCQFITVLISLLIFFIVAVIFFGTAMAESNEVYRKVNLPSSASHSLFNASTIDKIPKILT